MPYVRACAESDFDAVTGTCAHEVWIQQPSIVPELTIEDAQLIGMAFAFLFAVAFALRAIRKALETFN